MAGLLTKEAKQAISKNSSNQFGNAIKLEKVTQVQIQSITLQKWRWQWMRCKMYDVLQWKRGDEVQISKVCQNCC